MGGTAYVGSCAGRFYSFDITSGDTLWTYDVSVDGAEQFHGHPVVDDSIIVVGTDMGSRQHGTLYSLNRHDGSLRWKLEGNPGLAADVISRSGLLFTVSLADELIAVDATDGTVAWSTKSTWVHDPDRRVEGGTAPFQVDSNPVLYGDLILVRGRDNVVRAIEAETGEVRWSLPSDASITTQLCLAGDRVVFGTEALELLVVDARSGTVETSHPIDRTPFGTMSYHEPLLIYLAGESNARPRHVVSLDLTTGVVVWERELEDPDPEVYWYVPRIHLWETNVIVGSTKGLLVAYDVELGEPAWRHQLEGAIRGIGHTDDVLLVGTFEGMLYALRIPQK